jgi:hypothetical protein
MKGRILIGVFGAMLAIALLLQLLGASGGSSDNSPVANTGGQGFAGFVQLLESQRNIEVVTGREPLAESLADTGNATIVVFNRFLDDEEREQLLQHAALSRVVVVGTDTAEGLGLGTETSFVDGDVFVDDPFVLGGATRLRVTGLGWSELEVGAEAVAMASDTVVIAAIPGEDGGALYGVSTASLFFNQNLVEVDNAAAVLNLMGDTDRVVVYDSGFENMSTGFEAIPWRARWLLAGLSLAALIAAWSIGRRNGPAEQPHRDLPPPRSAYAESLGRMMDRSHQSRFRKHPPANQEHVP